MADIVIGLARPRAASMTLPRSASMALPQAAHMRSSVTLDTSHRFLADFGFLPDEDGINVFNVNPARVIPALGTIR
jgi:hypothetical protein